MTDAEIMKGVKLCNGDLGNCKECPFDSIGKTCGIELAKAEIGLIERLQAENVALRNEADENAAISMENKMRADRLEKENAALRERLEKAVELPYSHLEMLKLLTCASICYAEIKKLIVARMAKSRDVVDLFMECPTVQGTILDLALYRLSEANLNCNKIKGFEEIISATGSFKDYLAKAEARLAELKGEEKNG